MEKQTRAAKQNIGEKEPLRILTHPMHPPRQGRRKTPGSKMPDASTRKNKLAPPEKGKQGDPGSASSSECQVAMIAVSGNEGEASTRTIEVQISHAVAGDKSEATLEAEEDAMGKANEEDRYRQEKKEGGGSRESYAAKAREEYDLEKRRIQEEHQRKKRGRKGEEARSRARKEKDAPRKAPTRKAAGKKKKREESPRGNNRLGNLREEIGRAQQEMARDLNIIREKVRKGKEKESRKRKKKNFYANNVGEWERN